MENGYDMVPDAARAAAALPPGQIARRTQDSRGFNAAIVVAVPRDLSRVERAVLAEANKLGDTAYYGWAVGGEKGGRVEGPSKELAMVLVRNWGNAAVDMLPMEETADAYIFTAAFVDLETGFTLTRQFRQSKKWTVSGKMDQFRKEDIRFQIGQTKATRNVILNALPKWLVQAALDQAKQGVRTKIETFVQKKGMPEAQAKMLESFARFGVTEAMFCGRVDRARKEQLTIDNLVTLRGDLASLENGEALVEELFPPDQQATAQAAVTTNAECEPHRAKIREVVGLIGTERAARVLEHNGFRSLRDCTECNRADVLAVVANELDAALDAYTAEPEPKPKAGKAQAQPTLGNIGDEGPGHAQH